MVGVPCGRVAVRGHAGKGGRTFSYFNKEGVNLFAALWCPCLALLTWF